MAGLEIAKEIGEKIVKEGLKTAVDKLKEGVNPKEALKEGWETLKESSFKELDKFLSPESAEKLEDLGKEVDKIQDSIELSSPESFAETKTETVEDVIFPKNRNEYK